jgi:hypothetical protein
MRVNLFLGAICIIGGMLAGCGSYRPLSQKSSTVCLGEIKGSDASVVRRELADMVTLVTNCPDSERVSIIVSDDRTVLDYNDLSISNLYRRTYTAILRRGDRVETVEFASSYKDVGTNYFAQTMTERTNEDNNLKMLAQKIYQTLIMMK